MSTEAAPQSTSAPARPHNTLRLLSLVLVGVGLVISGYLSYVKLANTATVCLQGGAFNCEVVTHSVYSRFLGIDIAYLGFIMYLTVGLLLLLENRVPFLRDYGFALEFGIILFAWLFSMWLVYVQFFLLQALCPWCLAHETNMTILFIVTLLRLRKILLA